MARADAAVGACIASLNSSSCLAVVPRSRLLWPASARIVYGTRGLVCAVADFASAAPAGNKKKVLTADWFEQITCAAVGVAPDR